MSLTTLQNGSDIRGVALAGVEDEPVTLTSEAVARIAAAFSLWLQETAQLDEPRICIGHDSRLSAAPLKAAACEGIQSKGALCWMRDLPLRLLYLWQHNLKTYNVMGLLCLRPVIFLQIGME